MKLTTALSVFLVMGSTNYIHAEKSKPTAEISDPVKRKLFIDPSSTSVRLGKATLIVSPLSRRGGNYIGDYQLKVRPYFFKSETGSLILSASEDFVRRLQSGRAIDFTGKALTREDRTTHVVLGRATPLSGDRGTVTFSIVTEKTQRSFSRLRIISRPSPHGSNTRQHNLRCSSSCVGRDRFKTSCRTNSVKLRGNSREGNQERVREV